MRPPPAATLGVPQAGSGLAAGSGAPNHHAPKRCHHGAASCALTPASGLFNTSPFLPLPHTQHPCQGRPQKDKSGRWIPNETLLRRQSAGARPAQPAANPSRAPERTSDPSSCGDGRAAEPSGSWGHHGGGGAAVGHLSPATNPRDSFSYRLFGETTPAGSGVPIHGQSPEPLQKAPRSRGTKRDDISQ